MLDCWVRLGLRHDQLSKCWDGRKTFFLLDLHFIDQLPLFSQSLHQTRHCTKNHFAFISVCDGENIVPIGFYYYLIANLSLSTAVSPTICSYLARTLADGQPSIKSQTNGQQATIDLHNVSTSFLCIYTCISCSPAVKVIISYISAVILMTRYYIRSGVPDQSMDNENL